MTKLGTCCEALEAAARGYVRKKGKPAVLVIDSAELLAEHDALGELLEAAKGWADRGLVRMVLVSSDDAFVQRLSCEYCVSCMRACVHVCARASNHGLPILHVSSFCSRW